ncbi:hypothetical protein M2343_002308 [Sphingobium sp. B8D3B]|nr:hypothetical protein [Sphingobium sp. B8D3B]
MKRDKVTPPMPPISARHIIDRLVEMGISQSNGMGSSPLCFTEIEAWQRVTGVRLAPWEARLIRKLSSDYLAESRKAESENCPPPWRWKVTQAERTAELALLEEILG